MLNFLSNALKFTERRGKVTILIQFVPKKEELVAKGTLDPQV